MIKVSAKSFRSEAFLSSKNKVRLELKEQMKTRQSRIRILTTMKQKQRDKTILWEVSDMSIT